MPKDDFSKVKFDLGNVKFKDNRKLLTSNIKGNFSREAIRKNLQTMSDALQKGDKSAKVGCAMHYKGVNDWVPALFTDAGEAVKLFDPSDSDKGAIYEGDTIDGCQFYVIKQGTDTKFLKPSKFDGKLLLPVKKGREVTKKIFD